MNKTVYFLGAGFSKPAGGPIQNEIIKTILSPEFESEFRSRTSVMKALESFKNFLKKELCIEDNRFEHVELENVFTPIDRCIVDGKSFGSYSAKSLGFLREQLHLLMARAIQFRVDLPHTDKAYIASFATFLNKEAKTRITNYEDDRISIISTNWDILLDNKLQEAIDSDSGRKLGVVDYCCYISSLEEDNRIKPGLYALAKGGYNIKFLKLHGSMNWLHCPMCQRMYIIFNSKPMLSVEKHYCKHCKKNHNLGEIKAIELRGNLLLPTFLKDLNNIQIKLVWQNAGVELSEAEKIIFIGYSLPAADFEIRQLLSRSIRKDAEIDVLIYPGSDDTSKRNEKERYNNFFGSRKINFIEKTVPEYVTNLS